MADPFDVFQIEPRFDLDLKELGQRHRDLSRALHPDRYAGRSSLERRQALNRAIEVNEAWRTLKDPLKRAEVLLARLGVPIEEGSHPPASPEFLMEMMEHRETLRDLGRRGDVEAVEVLTKQVRAEEQRVLAELSEGLGKAFAGADGEIPRGLQQRLGELRYFRRFFDEAEAILDESS